ncbi:DUF5316 domain-containing protein [Pseudalkalibacillus decolorationis]|uniref:DUF5316 domain-containing protein n=1 Tax=Pseudalkalibacillus decolorationis TaxID=163879 RepID=UPI0021491665|nr:DUF5316 domain-containing protein [Pseudalkalibacillus decolorationis]
MKKSFLVGLSILGISILISLFTNDWNMLYTISGTAGVVALFISGLYIGAFISGNQIRGNHYSENKTDRKRRRKYANNLSAFSAPNLLGVIIMYFL